MNKLITILALFPTLLLAQSIQSDVATSSAYFAASEVGKLKVIVIHPTELFGYEEVATRQAQHVERMIEAGKIVEAELAKQNALPEAERSPVLFVVQGAKPEIVMEEGDVANFKAEKVSYLRELLHKKGAGSNHSVMGYQESGAPIQKEGHIYKLLVTARDSIEDVKVEFHHLEQEGRTTDRVIQEIGTTQALGLAEKTTIKLKVMSAAGNPGLALATVNPTLIALTQLNKQGRVNGEVIYTDESGKEQRLEVKEYLKTPIVLGEHEAHFVQNGHTKSAPSKWEIGRAMLGLKQASRASALEVDKLAYDNHVEAEVVEKQDYSANFGGKEYIAESLKHLRLEAEAQVAARAQPTNWRNEMSKVLFDVSNAEHASLLRVLDQAEARSKFAAARVVLSTPGPKQNYQYAPLPNGRLPVTALDLMEGLKEIRAARVEAQGRHVRAKGKK